MPAGVSDRTERIRYGRWMGDGGSCSTKTCSTFSSEDAWLYASISFILKPRKLHISLRWNRSTCSANKKEDLLCLLSNGTAYGFIPAADKAISFYAGFDYFLSTYFWSCLIFRSLHNSYHLHLVFFSRCYSPSLAFCLPILLSLYFSFYITINKSYILLYIALLMIKRNMKRAYDPQNKENLLRS